MWSRFTRGETNFDFVGLRRRWFALSGVLILVSLLGLAFRGLNLGLEFQGGALVQAPNPAAASLTDVRRALADLSLPDVRVQLVNEGAAVRIQTGPLDSDVQERLVSAVVGVTGSDRRNVSLETVGPTFGALVAKRALLALTVFLGAAALFISWRLQWKMAVTGLAALAHDVVLTVGVYAVTGFEVTPATVVALLTILGYSLYDTVVVFDRVQELEEGLADRITYSDLVNRAMNQVLARSLATSLTSLLPVGGILFVGAFILGATSLQDFALALFVGIAAGTYSSLFIAGPLLAAWREHEPEWVRRRERSGAARPAAPRPKTVAEEEPRAASPGPTRTAPPVPPKGVPPRPPKRRRR